MSEITKAEKYLLEQIRRGKDQAWAQFVERYEGRLLSFAQARLPRRADSEDIVQETFVSFIQSLNRFRSDCSLETYLFTLLRRKIIDCYRRRRISNTCLIQDVYHTAAVPDSYDAFKNLAANEPTASWYVRRDEQQNLQQRALVEGLLELVNGLKKTLNFRDLKIVELIFYSRVSNTDAAKIMNLSESRISVIKHRCFKQVRNHIAKSGVSMEPPGVDFENLLNSIWQLQRLSCPKRSTIGAYMLETLERDWHDYVDFHLNTLGCRFCRANLEDLRTKNKENNRQDMYDRIMESTVGFLKKP